MLRKQDRNQLTMEEFCLHFGEGLRSDNRWVRMSRLIPWDLVEEIYADRLSAEKWRAAMPSRVTFGALYIKEQENLTDAGTVTYLSENPYARYFVGLKEFQPDPLFGASTMVHFCKVRKRSVRSTRSCMNGCTRERRAIRMNRAVGRPMVEKIR